MIHSHKRFIQHTDSFMNHLHRAAPNSDSDLNRQPYTHTDEDCTYKTVNEDDNGKREAYSTSCNRAHAALIGLLMTSSVVYIQMNLNIHESHVSTEA